MPEPQAQGATRTSPLQSARLHLSGDLSRTPSPSGATLTADGKNIPCSSITLEMDATHGVHLLVRIPVQAVDIDLASKSTIWRS